MAKENTFNQKNNKHQEFNKREVATFILIDMFAENAYGNIILRKTLSNYDKETSVSKSDKNFVVEVVNGTMRNLIYIDYVINEISKTKTTKMKPFILNLLRMSTYQLIFMDNIKTHACCNEAVILAKKKGFVNLSGFVNGVLRNILRRKDGIELPDMKEEPLLYLSTKHSFPMWLLTYWFNEMKIEFNELECICKALNTPPQISIVTNTTKTTTEKLEKQLISENVEILSVSKEYNTMKIKSTGNISKLKSFENGLFHVMNDSSVYAVAKADVKNGMNVLDACAAPGGKSFLMACQMENKGVITAFDIHEHKIDLINDGAKRLGLNIVKPTLQDACELNGDLINKFDVVLLDVPCSGFGIINKKPDIKYNKIYDDMKELAIIQKDILKVCSQYVKLGGILLYSTCTISKRENQDNVKWFLDNYDFEPIAVNDETGENFIQIMPSENGLDGFFVAKFLKK